LTVIDDEVCLSPEEEDEYLTPVVLLHIAYEVVCKLDKTAYFRQLSLEELSLPDFLIEQIYYLEPVVEAQEDFATPLARDTVDSVQAPWPSHSDATSFGCLLGAPTCVDGQVVVDCRGPIICSREVILSPLPWGPKPPWDDPPCLLNLSSLLLVGTMVACTLTPS
jgi:hypothetical protein